MITCVNKSFTFSQITIKKNSLNAITLINDLEILFLRDFNVKCYKRESLPEEEPLPSKKLKKFKLPNQFFFKLAHNPEFQGWVRLKPCYSFVMLYLFINNN